MITACVSVVGNTVLEREIAVTLSTITNPRNQQGISILYAGHNDYQQLFIFFTQPFQIFSQCLRPWPLALPLPLLLNVVM